MRRSLRPESGEIIEKQLRTTVMRLKIDANTAYVPWNCRSCLPKISEFSDWKSLE
jgi:hypothetical protein